jgi:hypothetical protein
MRRQTSKLDIARGVVRDVKLVLVDKAHRERWIERSRSFNLFQVLLSQSDAQSLDVGLEVFDPTLTNNWEHVWCLVHDISKSYAMHGCLVLIRSLLKSLRHCNFLLTGLRSTRSTFVPFAASLLGLESALAKRTPRCDRHALTLTHGDDVSLHVSVRSVPFSLIDGEGTQAVSTSVVISLDHNPGRCIGDSEVQHFASINQGIESMHDFLDTCGKVPPVNVEEVNVIGAELLQRAIDRDVHGLERVADKVRLKRFHISSMAAVSCGILGCHSVTRMSGCLALKRKGVYHLHHLIAVLPLLHPFTKPFF